MFELLDLLAGLPTLAICGPIATTQSCQLRTRPNGTQERVCLFVCACVRVCRCMDNISHVCIYIYVYK